MSTDLGKGHLAMLAASVMWGAMAPVSKYVMSAGLVGSIVVTDVRIFGAAVLFWIFSLFAGSEKVRKKDYLNTCLQEAFGAYYAPMTTLMQVREWKGLQARIPYAPNFTN